MFSFFVSLFIFLSPAIPSIIVQFSSTDEFWRLEFFWFCWNFNELFDGLLRDDRFFHSLIADQCNMAWARGTASERSREREREIVLESPCKQIQFNFQFSKTEVRNSMYTRIWLNQLYYLLWYNMCCTVVRCNCDVCFIEINGDRNKNFSLLSVSLSFHIYRWLDRY